MFNPVPVPFFGAKKVADGFVVRGDLSHEFGHRVPAETGGPDDGVFAGWKWQGRRLTVEVDRYGFGPLFYFSRGDEFGISPNLVRLLQEGAPLEVDREAIAVFLHLGFFIGNQTPFRHIKVVPPNRSFTWDGTLHVEEVRHIGSQLKITRSEAIERYAGRCSAPPSRGDCPEAATSRFRSAEGEILDTSCSSCARRVVARGTASPRTSTAQAITMSRSRGCSPNPSG